MKGKLSKKGKLQLSFVAISALYRLLQHKRMRTSKSYINSIFH